MPGYVHAALHSFQHEKPKIPQDSPYPWTQPKYGEKNKMLFEKAPAGKLDDNNQKILQNIVGSFLYYDRAVDPTILMALKSLLAVQTKPTIESTKK